MKRLCQVGEAIDFDDVISVRVLENKISDLQIVFKQEINDKLTEILKKVKAKEAAEVFAKRKSLMMELKLLMKTRVKTSESFARMKFIREKLRKLDV